MPPATRAPGPRRAFLKAFELYTVVFHNEGSLGDPFSANFNLNFKVRNQTNSNRNLVTLEFTSVLRYIVNILPFYIVLNSSN